MNKAELRRQVRSRFPGAEQRDAESALICGHILASDLWKQAETIGLYVPMKREADVSPLFVPALRGRLILPRVEGPGEMTLRRVRSLGELSPGAYGIPEPSPDAEIIIPGELDLLLVPLEAITRSGVRLGKGGGYYDRLLCGLKCPSVGVVLSHQWVDDIPADPWDKNLSAAVDAERIVFF